MKIVSSSIPPSKSTDDLMKERDELSEQRDKANTLLEKMKLSKKISELDRLIVESFKTF